LSKALQALQPFATGPNPSAEMLTLYGRAVFLSGNAALAEQALTQATQQSPVAPVAFRYLADAEARLGHQAAARDARARYETLAGDSAG
jgi:predicted Zn-dependent protease